MEKRGLSGFIERYAKVLVVLAVIGGATSGVLGRAITATPVAIGFWRLTMGLPFFAVPVLLNKRAELRSIDRRDMLTSAASGVFLCAHFICWFTAVKMTSIASASVLGSLHPLAVLAISILIYKKKIGPKPIIGIILAIVGAAITAGFDYGELTREYFIGDVVALISAAFMGTYFAIGEKARERIPGSIHVFILFLACWVSFLIVMLVTGTPFFAYPEKDWLLLIAMTLFCQIGAHAVFNLCLGHVDSVYVSTWETSDSVFEIIMALIFIGQVPTKWAVVGCLVVAAGLIYYNRHADE